MKKYDVTVHVATSTYTDVIVRVTADSEEEAGNGAFNITGYENQTFWDVACTLLAMADDGWQCPGHDIDIREIKEVDEANDQEDFDIDADDMTEEDDEDDGDDGDDDEDDEDDDSTDIDTNTSVPSAPPPAPPAA